MSVLHATYLRCIRPYVTPETVALEIGPGKGAWTKALLGSREVWVLDALSAEHNHFFEYLGDPHNVKYVQVDDLKCEMLPNDFFNYMFSFGCLCHLSFGGITQYAASIYSKLRKGSHCFWMVADYEKYNAAVAMQESLSISQFLVPRSGRRFLPVKWLVQLLESKVFAEPWLPLAADKDEEPRPGRFYNAGTERTCSMLIATGYEIVDPDVGTNHRDPIIHFLKP
ncbi:MAG: class I SAM-dependent methyltransferase [Acidobacteriota bacterium]